MRKLIIILALLIPSISLSKGPNYQWVCWANSDTSPDEEGTYSVNKSKSVARKAALDLCEEMFDHCHIEYCQKIR